MTRIITRTAIALLNKVANADRRYREQAKLRAMPVERLADMGMTPPISTAPMPALLLARRRATAKPLALEGVRFQACRPLSFARRLPGQFFNTRQAMDRRTKPQTDLPDLAALRQGQDIVARLMGPTPQTVWPGVRKAVGAEVWIKHENRSPIGSFKLRGAATFIDWLRRHHPGVPGVIAATRGNQGQALAMAARAAGMQARIIVPFGNSPMKNAAIRALGAELIEYGDDFDAARLHSHQRAREDGLWLVPPYHPEITQGAASWALELFAQAPDLDALYVPIGGGTGICGAIAARQALGLNTPIIGVVASGAASAKLSVEAGRLIEIETARTIADGMAVRMPVAQSFEIYRTGAARIIAVSDEQIKAAMRMIHAETGERTEGAGAAALAGCLSEAHATRGKTLGAVLTGGNVDDAVFAQVLAQG